MNRIFEIQKIIIIIIINRSQYICLLGIEGSGKTAICNLILRSLPLITESPSNIEAMIEKVNKVIKAFCGACTINNEVSNRFGKMIRINFDQTGRMKEIQFLPHLFEKFRVVQRPLNESNFLIFYQLIKGVSLGEREFLGIQDIGYYRYLQSWSPTCSENDLNIVRDCMSSIGFSDYQIDSLFEVASVVLLLGNVKFIKTPGGVKIENIEGNHFIQKK